MYEHQDWNTVVLKVKKEGNGKDEKSVRQAQQHGYKVETQVKQQGTNTLVSIKKLEDNPEAFQHKKIDKELADAIKNKRIELKLTQAMLAQRINEKPNVIQEVEIMKAVYNHMIINKILKALGLTLKNIRKQ
jgi:ribosome-binding protein aMBF1 (putative translation factor)